MIGLGPSSEEEDCICACFPVTQVLLRWSLTGCLCSHSLTGQYNCQRKAVWIFTLKWCLKRGNKIYCNPLKINGLGFKNQQQRHGRRSNFPLGWRRTYASVERSLQFKSAYCNERRVKHMTQPIPHIPYALAPEPELDWDRYCRYSPTGLSGYWRVALELCAGKPYNRCSTQIKNPGQPHQTGHHAHSRRRREPSRYFLHWMKLTDGPQMPPEDIGVKGWTLLWINSCEEA